VVGRAAQVVPSVDDHACDARQPFGALDDRVTDAEAVLR
jgi:hypothetical protein